MRRGPVPLYREQVEAAGRLYDCHLEQWRAADAALADLHWALPGFSVEASLLKVSAINTLYSTNVRAVWRMAQHIASTAPMLAKVSDPASAVDAVAGLAPLAGDPPRRHRSFASKFCHFFIDEDRFPIFDQAARSALALHLPPSERQGIERSYGAFLSALEALRRRYTLAMPHRELDRYLWLAGSYAAYRRGRRDLNRELLVVFRDNSADGALSAMLG